MENGRGCDAEGKPVNTAGQYFVAPCLYTVCTPCEAALRFAREVEKVGVGEACKRQYVMPQPLLTARDECAGFGRTELRLDLALSTTDRRGMRLLRISLAQRPIDSGALFVKAVERRNSFKQRHTQLLWPQLLVWLAVELHKAFTRALAHRSL